MKVKAKAKGYYGAVRIREGQVFLLNDKSHFSKVWMTEVKTSAPKTKSKAVENKPEVKETEVI